MAAIKIFNQATGQWEKPPIAKGDKGDAYILTQNDKEEIADLVRDEYFNDIDTALDKVISIQNDYIGGNTE